MWEWGHSGTGNCQWSATMVGQGTLSHCGEGKPVAPMAGPKNQVQSPAAREDSFLFMDPGLESPCGFGIPGTFEFLNHLFPTLLLVAPWRVTLSCCCHSLVPHIPSISMAMHCPFVPRDLGRAKGWKALAWGGIEWGRKEESDSLLRQATWPECQ